MSTILVPLDETAFAESILPDAEQLAAPGGGIVLVYVVARSGATSDVERYLTNEAQLLKARGFRASSKVLLGGDIPRAIDEGVSELGAGMVAVATHGTGERGRLSRSSIAWKSLAHSPVPILLRHAQEGRVRDLDERRPEPVRIMVPLDGSARAERAIPLAARLAGEWQGSLVLAQISSDSSRGQEYLDRMALDSAVPVKTALAHGSAGENLAKLAGDLGVTHVVMTSHGRSGLSRVIAGDVAADLIERISLPIVVIPSLSEAQLGPNERPLEKAAPAASGATGSR
jgi:nucleotide-binding universal stress UspA family protein